MGRIWMADIKRLRREMGMENIYIADFTYPRRITSLRDFPAEDKKSGLWQLYRRKGVVRFTMKKLVFKPQPDIVRKQVNVSWVMGVIEEGEESPVWLVDYLGQTVVIDTAQKLTEAMKEKAAMQSLPSWLRLESLDIFGEGEAAAVVRQRQKLKAEGKAGSLDECQADAIAPSLRDRMEGYYRVALFPTDGPIQNRPKNELEKKRSKDAKKKAENYKKQIQNKILAEGGQNIAIRVMKLRCDDATPAGFYWTVWLNTPREEDAAAFVNIETGEVVGAGVLSDEGRKARREIEMAETPEGTRYERTTRRVRRGGQTAAGGHEETAVGTGFAEGVPKVQAARPAARVHETCPVCNAPALSKLSPEARKLWSKPKASSDGVGCRSGWVYPEDFEFIVQKVNKKGEPVVKNGEPVMVRAKPDGKPTNPHLPRVNKYVERVGMDEAIKESQKARRNI